MVITLSFNLSKEGVSRFILLKYVTRILPKGQGQILHHQITGFVLMLSTSEIKVKFDITNGLLG